MKTHSLFRFATLAALVALLILTAESARAEGARWHHLHLTATNTKEAAQWYADNMDGEFTKFSGIFDAAKFGRTVVIFFKKKEGFPGSDGSSVDHIGWSFPDLDAKMKGFEEKGIRIVAPARAIGAIKFGFIEDPWGTKIEVMQDPDLLGFHHVHLHTPDVDGTVKWLTDSFGGEAGKYANFLPAVRYEDLWVILQKVPKQKEGTQGRSIDHLGWSFPDLDAAAERLKAQGVKFTVEPRPLGTTKIAFIEGPDGVLHELVEEKPAAE